MSRFLTACLTALMFSFSGVSVLCAQEQEATAPVDIRPPAVHARTPARSKPRKVVVAPTADQAVSPELPVAEAPSKPKPRTASRKRTAAKPVVKPAAAKAEVPPKVDGAKESAKAEPAKTDGDKPAKDTTAATQKVTPAVATPADFCSNIADLAAETRAKVRADQLAALEADLRTRISELEAKKTEVQSWVERQEMLRKQADESVLAILGKMKSESAAAQIALMDDPTAAAVLMKLGPKTASAILNDMGATKAARITESMMASRVAARNDGAKSAN